MTTSGEAAIPNVAPADGLCIAARGVRRPRLLVPVDCTEFTASVLDVAACTARLMNAEVHLLAILGPEHDLAVFPETPYTTFEGEVWASGGSSRFPTGTRGQADEAARAAAEDYLCFAAKKFDGLPVTSRVLIHDAVANAVIDYARAVEIDLIAMPTHGRRRLGEALLGSVAGEVVHSGVAPCLLVKPR